LIDGYRYIFQDVVFLKGIGMNKKYIVRLTAKEREDLEILTTKGTTQAYRIKHANILLAVDGDGPNWPDHQVAKAYKCHQNTVRNVRQRFVEQGLDVALERKKQDAPSCQRIIDGEAEARLITIACSTPPEGYAKWTMQMLADEMVALHVVDSVSSQTVWRTLKKTNLNLT
jgi:transposase